VKGVIGRPPAPDPEIGRQRRLHADRENTGPTPAAGDKDPIAILAPVFRRHDAWCPMPR